MNLKEHFKDYRVPIRRGDDIHKDPRSSQNMHKGIKRSSKTMRFG